MLRLMSDAYFSSGGNDKLQALLRQPFSSVPDFGQFQPHRASVIANFPALVRPVE